MGKIFIGISIIFILLSFSGFGQQLDVSDSKIICFEKKDPVVLKAVSVLKEEVQKRSKTLFPIITKWPCTPQTIIAIGQESDLAKFPENLRSAISKMETTGKDG